MDVDETAAEGGQTQQLPVALTAEEKTWGMLCHLTPLLAYLAVGMTFLGPLICWLMKKDSSKFVDYNGKESLNFQLNVLIYSLLCIPLFFVCIGFFLLAALHVYSIISCIIAGMKANNGEIFRYPFVFRIIK